MHDLVEATIEAHGGLEAWRKVREVSADFTPFGPSLKARGPLGEEIEHMTMGLTVNTREQEVSFAGYLDPGHTGIYRPDRTRVVAADGALVEDLHNPRASLTQMAPGTPWTATQILYFLGYSLWMYVTLPYSFHMEGVTFEEVEPLEEGGETWRALKVTYPASFPTHSTEQIHYFDEYGYMRRQDYTVDIRQDLGAAHYMSGHRKFDGFLFPTQRRIYRAGANRTPLKDELLIAGDFENFRVTRDA
jgi:hypothetical protein